MTKIRTIIGHTLQQEQLNQDITSGNVSHAYLFSGPQNLGKMSLARQFAGQLLSGGVMNDNIKHQLEKLTHPDYLVMDQLWIEGVCDNWDVISETSNVPQGHRAKKPGAKTDVISIDDIRALQERLYDTSVSPYRCCLIRKVERMQDAAANAFLKILEEPPAGLVFILTTESAGQLLPTIPSRARVLSFRRLAPATLRELLDGVPDDDAQFILHIAQGAPGTVVELAEDPDFLREHRTIHGQAQQFWRTSSPKDRMTALKPLAKRGEEADRLLFHLGLTLREQAPEINTEQLQAYQQLVRGLRTNAHRQLLSQRFALHA